MRIWCACGGKRACGCRVSVSVFGGFGKHGRERRAMHYAVHRTSRVKLLLCVARCNRLHARWLVGALIGCVPANHARACFARACTGGGAKAARLVHWSCVWLAHAPAAPAVDGHKMVHVRDALLVHSWRAMQRQRMQHMMAPCSPVPQRRRQRAGMRTGLPQAGDALFVCRRPSQAVSRWG